MSRTGSPPAPRVGDNWGHARTSYSATTWWESCCIDDAAISAVGKNCTLPAIYITLGQVLLIK